MSFFQRLFSRPDSARDAQKTSDTGLPDVSLRRRNFTTLAAAKSEAVVAAPEQPQVEQTPKAAKRPSAPKKPKAAVPSVMESISVVMRRQVPIRFEEEARSWIGGLPKMPVGIEWPRAKPKKPLHFVAQIACADLLPELWGGLGPRDGWLLLFVDMEALTEDIKRPYARVIHTTEPGPEAEPPQGLYWSREHITDVSQLKGTLPKAQRQHFRQWPVDFVTMAADTSKLTGTELYGAPENDRVLFESSGFAAEYPMTWRGAYTVLAGLVLKHNAEGYESNWKGNSLGMLDYPEPDINERNSEWQTRRERIAAQLPAGYHCPEFWEAVTRLEAEMYEERRKGWMRRAFKVLAEETTISIAHLDKHRAKVAAASAQRDRQKVFEFQQSVDYFEKQVADRHAHRVYLEELFAQYPSEEAFVAEINRVGLAHLEWAQWTRERLREMLDQAGKMDFDAPIDPRDWDAIAAEIASMKTVYWQKTFDTDVLRKVERSVSCSLSDTVREEVLDRYASPPPSADGLDPDVVADLEPRLRHFETDRPHKLGGMIDSVYDDPLKKDHILLFQMASDAATGWIFGDLGLLYVSIAHSDLEAGSFDNVRAWLEA